MRRAPPAATMLHRAGWRAGPTYLRASCASKRRMLRASIVTLLWLPFAALLYDNLFVANVCPFGGWRVSTRFPLHGDPDRRPLGRGGRARVAASLGLLTSANVGPALQPAAVKYDAAGAARRDHASSGRLESRPYVPRASRASKRRMLRASIVTLLWLPFAALLYDDLFVANVCPYGGWRLALASRFMEILIVVPLGAVSCARGGEPWATDVHECRAGSPAGRSQIRCGGRRPPRPCFIGPAGEPALRTSAQVARPNEECSARGS